MNYNIQEIHPESLEAIKECKTNPYITCEGEDTVYKIFKLKNPTKDNEYALQPVCSYCYIKTIYTVLETEEQMIVVEHVNSDGELKELPPINRSLISDNKISYLMKYGITFQHLFRQDFANYLCKTEEFAEKKSLHRSIGYRVINKQPVFLLDRVISEKNNVFESTYQSELGYDLAPKGTLEPVLEAVKKHIIGQSGSEVAILASLAAPILTLLPREQTNGESLLLQIYGDSSRGKSTAAKFAVSMWASPLIGGLYHNGHLTENSLIAPLEDTCGVCHVFDEIGIYKKTGLLNEIYILANGEGKSRCSSNGKQRKIGKFQDTILFTGEIPMTNDKAMTGQLLRFIEINDKYPLFRSKDSAEYIEKIANHHYGVLGSDFVQRLLALDKRKLIKLYEVYRTKMEKSITKNNFSFRMIKKYALILVTARLVNDFYSLGFDLEKIQEIFIQREEELMNTRELDVRAFEKTKNFIAMNQTKFKATATPCYGITSGNEVFILRDILDDFLKNNDFANRKKILKCWRGKGWLITEPDRLYSRKTVGNMPKCAVYHLKFKNENI